MTGGQPFDANIHLREQIEGTLDALLLAQHTTAAEITESIQVFLDQCGSHGPWDAGRGFRCDLLYDQILKAEVPNQADSEVLLRTASALVGWLGGKEDVQVLAGDLFRDSLVPTTSTRWPKGVRGDWARFLLGQYPGACLELCENWDRINYLRRQVPPPEQQAHFVGALHDLIDLRLAQEQEPELCHDDLMTLQLLWSASGESWVANGEQFKAIDAMRTGCAHVDDEECDRFVAQQRRLQLERVAQDSHTGGAVAGGRALKM